MVTGEAIYPGMYTRRKLYTKEVPKEPVYPGRYLWKLYYPGYTTLLYLPGYTLCIHPSLLLPLSCTRRDQCSRKTTWALSFLPSLGGEDSAHRGPPRLWGRRTPLRRVMPDNCARMLNDRIARGQHSLVALLRA